MENNNFIKECFETLKEKQPDKFLSGKNQNNNVKTEIINIEEKINYFEKKYNIKYPDLYKSFLENYTQHLKQLEGSIIFKIKTMKIKLYFWRISDLAKKYEKYRKIINKGYIPFGNNNEKIFTLNTKYNNVITTFDSKNINDNNWEEYYYDMFENFEAVLECFFKDNYYKYDRKKLVLWSILFVTFLPVFFETRFNNYNELQKVFCNC